MEEQGKNTDDYARDRNVKWLRERADLYETYGRYLYNNESSTLNWNKLNQKFTNFPMYQAEICEKALNAYANILELKGLQNIEAMCREQYAKLQEITTLVGLKKAEIFDE